MPIHLFYVLAINIWLNMLKVYNYNMLMIQARTRAAISTNIIHIEFIFRREKEMQLYKQQKALGDSKKAYEVELFPIHTLIK